MFASGRFFSASQPEGWVALSDTDWGKEKNESIHTALGSLLYLFVNRILARCRSGPWHCVSMASVRPAQEQVARAAAAAPMTVPHRLRAVLSKVVGSSSVLPGPLNVLLLAPGAHHHGSLATFLILKQEKLIIAPCVVQLAVRIFQ